MPEAIPDSRTLPPLRWRGTISPLAWAVRRVLARQLDGIGDGEIVLTDGNWTRRFGRTTDSTLRAHVTVGNRRTYLRLAAGGTIGAAQAFAKGEWTVDDLTALVRIFARNRAVATGVDRRLGRIGEPLRRLLHAQRANTPDGSRKNVAAHYDLGNDFFQTFLDPTLSYSCAVYPRATASLEEASRFKLDLLCRKLNLEPGDELLEIGTGWGGLAMHAAATYGCRVTTTTVSHAQFTLARDRIRAAGLDHLVTVINLDYRHLPTLGRRFDKIVSVEMIEAVGEGFLPGFFRVCDSLLTPRGVMALQSIVIADALFDSYRASVDFIQRYIFPGGFLPSQNLVQRHVANLTDLRVVQVEDFTMHYARTLAEWRRAFLDRRSRLRSLGYADELLRMWDFYFSYCEGGFLERTIGLVQLVLAKPHAAPQLIEAEVAAW